MPELGQIAVNKRTGQRATFNGQAWIADAAPKSPVADASLRGRLAMGMGPMVDAQERMTTAEAGGSPLQRDWGAALLDKIPGLDDAAKWAGGQDFQEYQQAGKTFESQLMPIMSGAAVSPSEAERQIKAALPQLGDSKETLVAKARTRKMMLNGAAKAGGQPLPYPDVATYGVNSTRPGAPSSQTTPTAPTGERMIIDINGRPIK
jgi:hypothetical protein